MNIAQENIDELNALLKVTVDKEDYMESYTKTLKDYGKQMNMPGFRQGKVPVGIVKKKFGKSILAEELQKVLDSSIQNYIKEKDLKVLGQPLPIRDSENGNWDEPDQFEFSYELGLAPDFEVNLSSKHKVNYYTVKVDEKMVEEEVDRIRRRYGKLSDVEKSGESDMLSGEIYELREDGLEKEDGIRNETNIAIEYIKDKKSKKKLVGVERGAIIDVDPNKLSETHDDMGRMLGISHEEVHALPKKAKFQFKVNDIKQLTPAEMDEEFFSKVLPADQDQSEEGLRGYISDGLKKHFSNDSENMFKRDANRYFADKLKLKLPDNFLKKWIEVSNGEEKTAEEIEANYDDYASSIKWQLIKNRIITEKEIKVEFEDAMDFTKERLIENYAQYGMPAPEEEELKETTMRMMQDREQVEQIFDTIYESRVMAAVKEDIKLTEKEVSFEKFKDLASK